MKLSHTIPKNLASLLAVQFTDVNGTASSTLPLHTINDTSSSTSTRQDALQGVPYLTHRIDAEHQPLALINLTH